MSNPIFEEEQHFRQWWIWLILVLVAGSIAYSYIEAESPIISDFIVSISVFILVLILMFSAKLKTRIDEDGIHVKFFPFHLTTKTYPWEDISTSKVTTYSPLGDYGGWGLRYSFRGKGKAFNVSGNEGIWFETFSGKKRMLGTQKSNEAALVLKNYTDKS